MSKSTKEVPTQSKHEVSKLRYRTIFISDVHLGTPGCQADLLLDFLKRTDSETLFLIGDILDGWRLKRRWYWPQAHNDVLQKLLRKARKGTRVIFVPGNHDEFARNYDEMVFGDIVVKNRTEHVTALGLRILVIHGDEFDGVVRYHKWLAHLGSWAYDMTVVLNVWLNYFRRKTGLSYWSLASFLKKRVKEAVKFVTNFEEAAARHAAESGFDAVVCGHIHHPSMRQLRLADGGESVLYLNDGDWVETGSALVEDLDGRLHLLKWRLGSEPEVLASTASEI